MKGRSVLQKIFSNWQWMRKLSLVLAGAMVVGSTLSVNAASIEEVFDAEYYSSTYRDLKAAFGEDATALYDHYVNYGQKEGRTFVPFIDLVKYRERYADLDAAFGDDMEAYLNHYLEYGVYEGREAFGTAFNARAYADRYPDLKEAFGYDVLALYEHWLIFGIKEGRYPLADIITNNNSGSDGSGTPVAPAPEEVIPETVATTVVFVDEDGNPIPNAVVTFSRIANIGMNNNSERSVSGGDSGSVSGGDSGSVSGGDSGSVSGGDSGRDPGVDQNGDTFIVTTDSEGRYTVPELPSGVYTVDATAPGYLDLHMSQVTIGVEGSNQTIPTFEMLSNDRSGTNTVVGYAQDASTAAYLAGVTIKIRSGWNNFDGDVINVTSTDETGYYTFTLERGYYTVEFVGEGYTNGYVNIATSNRFNADRCSCALSSTVSEVTSGQYRIVLQWGEEPWDLDSHLVGPGEYGYFHVFFGNKVYMEDGQVKASLDVDDVTSYGPETVTLVNVNPNETYYYSIHDFTHSGYEIEEQSQFMYLANSSANVKVYDGSVLVKEYNVPATAGTIWNVFKIVNGTVITINEVNADYDTFYGEYLN